MKRALALFVSLALIGAAPTPKPTMPPGGLSIVINNTKLRLQPAPIFRNGVLFVPVRQTIEALGLAFNKNGKTIWTDIGANRVTLTIGTHGTIEIKNVLYAPLRFFTEVLGAQAVFDRKSNTVSIDAELVGTSNAGVVRHGNSVERFGTATAVDLNSDPPTITISSNANVKTVPIARNAYVEMHDVNANVTDPGELSDVRPGDFVRLYMDKGGHVARIEDAFGSYYDTVAASTGDRFVLSDGHVIVPSRTTQVSLNGQPAAMSDVNVGDVASVRYNIETNEVRSILLSRKIATSAVSANGPSISSVDLDANRPIKAGQTVTVTVHGTPGGAATFDIGPYVSNVSMAERSPGTYVGSYALPRSANFNDVPIIAHLRVAGVNAPNAQSAQTLSVAGSAPGIRDFAPDQNATVNTNRPAIFVTFATVAVGVNPSSILLKVNGRDVTANTVRTARYVQYMPAYNYPAGPVRVMVRVADRAGNTTTKSWSFTIKR
ncbi:MAG TPA: hypothetical protein VFN49_08230 [Candidatus Aquilonibacter sp.]|nr:hypothetical protein [Candidatus Aquilonibacter sp.]